MSERKPSFKGNSHESAGAELQQLTRTLMIDTKFLYALSHVIG